VGVMAWAVGTHCPARGWKGVTFSWRVLC
jgi:hypothetical protein